MIFDFGKLKNSISCSFIFRKSITSHTKLCNSVRHFYYRLGRAATATRAQMSKIFGHVHTYNTRYVTQKNLYKPRVRTNTGKQMILFKAIDLWKSVPQNLKDLNVYTFSKNIKHFLLSKQYSKKPIS